MGSAGFCFLRCSGHRPHPRERCSPRSAPQHSLLAEGLLSQQTLLAQVPSCPLWLASREASATGQTDSWMLQHCSAATASSMNRAQDQGLPFWKVS